MHKVTISDETSSGDILSTLELAFAAECITLKDLISARVTQEVEAYQNDTENEQSLVRLSNKEKVLNATLRIRKSNDIDIEKQIYIALSGFQQNAFFVIVNDTQVENLEDEIMIGKETTVSFIKLIPLVGG